MRQYPGTFEAYSWNEYEIMIGPQNRIEQSKGSHIIAGIKALFMKVVCFSARIVHPEKMSNWNSH